MSYRDHERSQRRMSGIQKSLIAAALALFAAGIALAFYVVAQTTMLP